MSTSLFLLNSLFFISFNFETFGKFYYAISFNKFIDKFCCFISCSKVNFPIKNCNFYRIWLLNSFDHSFKIIKNHFKIFILKLNQNIFAVKNLIYQINKLHNCLSKFMTSYFPAKYFGSFTNLINKFIFYFLFPF